MNRCSSPALAAALVAFLSLPALTSVVAAQETRQSATAKLDSEFAASDLDKDGYLSPAEIEARMAKMKLGGGRTLDATHAKRVAALFLARADTDKDGRVSKAESTAMMGAVFNAYDLNRDGKVDAGEMAKARAAGEAATGKK
ncbi:EF-hand domain-containing protein [Sphingomonas sp.]|jgi:Ca2+-binding EF-hand superfamily protein|uniref:EF-hand domain-containing protein n=1 Tax=Sphingomonas sp. TaxID=28214 RepID=UPI0035C7ACAF